MLWRGVAVCGQVSKECLLEMHKWGRRCTQAPPFISLRQRHSRLHPASRSVIIQLHSLQRRDALVVNRALFEEPRHRHSMPRLTGMAGKPHKPLLGPVQRLNRRSRRLTRSSVPTRRGSWRLGYTVRPSWMPRQRQKRWIGQRSGWLGWQATPASPATAYRSRDSGSRATSSTSASRC